MSHRVWKWGLALTVALVGAAGAQGERAGGTVARVGDQAITRTELDRYLLRYYGRAGVEQLIDRGVLELEAERLKVRVSPEDLNTAAARVKSEAGVRFAAALSAEGITEETWKERLRYVLLAEKVRDAKWPVRERQDLTRLSVRYARLQTEAIAKDIIQQAKRGASFQTLVLSWSLDKEKAGMVQPDPFLRIENPVFYQLAQELRPGQVSPRPIKSGEFWLVLRLDKVLPPDSLSPQQREAAVRKIQAARSALLLSHSRRRYNVEYPAPVAPLAENPAGLESATLAKVAPTGASEAEPRTYTGKNLRAHLLRYYGRTALDRLTERSLVSQEAARLRVSVSEPELNARLAEAKAASKTLFERSLQAEGITEEAWKERLRYLYLAERILNARSPVKPDALDRLSARYIRVKTRQEADAILGGLRMGAPFEEVRRRYSLDREGPGFLQPRAFLRLDNPTFFAAIPADMAEGQVLHVPVELDGFWFVLQLDKRLPAATMTAREREVALRRLQAPNVGRLLEDLRKEYPIEAVVPLKTLIAEAEK